MSLHGEILFKVCFIHILCAPAIARLTEIKVAAELKRSVMLPLYENNEP